MGVAMPKRRTQASCAAPLEVDVWRIALEVGAAIRLSDRRVLNPFEQARAARFLRPEHGWRWSRARAAMRRILAWYTGQEAAALKFADGLNAKPELALDTDERVHFNLSHSGHYALLAVSRHWPLGVDIEQHRELPDMMAIARRFFAPVEVARLRSIDVAHRRPAFFRCWTRKEAVLKASSEGIGDNLHRLTVSFVESAPPQVEVYQGSAEAARNWSLFDLYCPAGYSAALAFECQLAATLNYRDVDTDLENPAH